MSDTEFKWPDPTKCHSTQFSFDDSQIAPNLLSSPSLSKRLSFSPPTIPLSPSVADRDVVEALTVMQNGCLMMMHRVVRSDDDGNHRNTHSMEWNLVTLQNQKNRLLIGGSRPFHVSLHDITKVDKLDTNTISRFRDEMNIGGLNDIGVIGLQSLTLRLSMKDHIGFDYFLIFEEYRNAFIWRKGLETLLKMMRRGSGEVVTTTIAFCSSSLDRINNDEMYSKMKIDEVDNTLKWIQHIQSVLPSIQRHIVQIRVFSEKSCILDSSEHLSLLLRTNALNEMYMDAKRLSSLAIYELTKDEKFALREVWLSLMADLTVAMFKEHQLRGDMNASIAIPDMNNNGNSHNTPSKDSKVMMTMSK